MTGALRLELSQTPPYESLFGRFQFVSFCYIKTAVIRYLSSLSRSNKLLNLRLAMEPQICSPLEARMVLDL